MTIKPFDKRLYDADDNAKHLVISWLDTQGYDAEVNPDTYGIDLLGVNRLTQKPYEFEVEVKHNWDSATFPFDSIHIPARKNKFAKTNSYFVMLNSKRTHLLTLKGAQVASSPIVAKSTKYTGNEQFFEIPVSKAFFYPVEDDSGK